MDPVVERFAASFALILIVALSINAPASAITAELAKKCREMAIKAHPPEPPGGKTGTAQAERDFYRTCIANNGTAPTDDTNENSPPAAK